MVELLKAILKEALGALATVPGGVLAAIVAVVVMIFTNHANTQRLRLQQAHEREAQRYALLREKLEDLYIASSKWFVYLDSYFLSCRIAMRDEIPQDKTVEIPQDKTVEIPQDKTVEIPQDKTVEIPQDKTVEIPQDKTVELFHSYASDQNDDRQRTGMLIELYFPQLEEAFALVQSTLQEGRARVREYVYQPKRTREGNMQCLVGLNTWFTRYEEAKKRFRSAVVNLVTAA